MKGVYSSLACNKQSRLLFFLTEDDSFIRFCVDEMFLHFDAKGYEMKWNQKLSWSFASVCLFPLLASLLLLWEHHLLEKRLFELTYQISDKALPEIQALQKAMLAELQWIHNAAWFCLFLSMFFALAFTVRFSQSFRRAVLHLQRVMQQLGKGRLETRSELLTQDEWQELGDSLNQMATNLETTTISRNYLENILDSMVEALIITSPEGMMRSINRAGWELFDYAEQDLLGKPVDLLFNTDSESEKKAFLGAAHRELYLRGFVQDLERVCVARDGRNIPVLLSVALVQNEQGEAQEMICVVQDISARKLAEEKQHELEEQLRKTQKMEAIGVLAGGIAHEFNNILQGILGFTHLVQIKLPAATQEQHNLSQVQRLGLRASNLIRQILTYSRQENQEMEPVRLSPIVQDALKMMKATLPSTIEIHQHVETTDDTILANSDQIHQVVVNLCANAGYAMRLEGGALEVRLTQETVEETIEGKTIPEFNDYLKLSVRDTGEGVPSEAIDHIFDPFFTTKPTGEGSGMGLSVVLGIIENHSGTITCNSQPGVGTVFEVLLPQAEVVFQYELENQPLIEHPLGTVLFVDDESFLVEAAREFLTQLNCQVVATTSPLEALEQFKADPQRFDLVITDQTMAQMTGVELGKAVKQLRPDIPMVLVTGFSELVTEDIAKSIGFREYILKPLSFAALSRVVTSFLAKSL